MHTFNTCRRIVSITMALGLISAVSGCDEDETAPADIMGSFGEHLVNQEGEKVSTAELKGKKIGLYFSAQWCPPCRAFTPILVETYNELQEQEKPFEIVFVSADRTEDEMYAYMRDYEMDWLAFDFDDEKRTTLPRSHNVRGIPSLIIVDEAGNTLSKNGIDEVAEHGADAFAQW